MRFASRFYIVFFMLLSACSQTKIHLVTYGYSEQERQQIVKQFEQQELEIVLSDARVPHEFPLVSLAMNPSFYDYSIIAEIDKVLESLNMTREQEYRFAQGQHFYSKRNLGLYIKNPDVQAYPMPPFLRTQYCQTIDATMEFQPNGEFVLEYEIKGSDEGGYLADLLYQKGHYLFDGVTLTLFSENFPKIQYRLEKEQRETYAGKKPADVFYPKGDIATWPLASCEMLIIYMYD